MIVGLDIGGHHVAGALVDPSTWHIVPASYRRLEVERTTHREQLLNAWTSLIDEISAGAAVPVRGVGVAMPGPFDYASGTAYFEGTGKFESLYGVDVGQALSNRCRHGPEVRFLNDATAFGVGCTRGDPSLQSGRVIALTLGTGIGAAFCDAGMPVITDDAGRVPPHGSLWHLPFKDGIADDYVSSRWLLSRAAGMPGPKPQSVAELATAARATGRGREIFDEYGANLATIVAPWITRFDCDALVMGGRITGAFDLFSGSLEGGLSVAGASRPLIIHEDTEGAALLGAAACFDEAFWQVASTRLPRR